MMNKERMLLLADLLETITPEKFNIENWTLDIHHDLYGDSGATYSNQYHHASLSAYDCGTAGCIAGWAVAMKNDLDLKNFPAASVATEACDYLGLTEDQGRSLFYFGETTIWGKYRDDLGFDEAHGYADQIKAKHAAYALRQIADGEWEF
jgi:hypothetical protein